MTPKKASHATPTHTQATQAARTEEGAQAQAQAATAAASAPAHGDGAAVVSAQTPPAAPVHNPKRGGLYRQDGDSKPSEVHRTLTPEEVAAEKAKRT